LASGIPDLVLDDLTINVRGFGGKLNSKGRFGVKGEAVIDEAS
jgi:hypothetical protein